MPKVTVLATSLLLLACILLPALPPTANPQLPTVHPQPSTALTYIPGSSVKLEQLLGEDDKQLHQPTLSQTVTRYGIQGTDLGYSFENNGQVYFLFGDTVGRLGKALDTIAQTDATDPEQGVRLDFLTEGKDYLTVRPPGISMGAFETPNGGIRLNGQMYVTVRTNHSDDWSTDRALLTRFTLPARFAVLRTLSQAPAGHFLTMALHAQTADLPGLPPGGPYVYVWGTGAYRKSDAYLSIVPAANFESGQGTLYYSGLDASGLPQWSPRETEAQPVVRNGTLGDLSVTWAGDLNLWLMTYDSRAPAPEGILFSYAATPWGPWSQPQVIFNAGRDGALGSFIHDPSIHPDDGLAGPVIGVPQSQAGSVHGGAYAPYVVERWTKVQDGQVSIYYTLSTWNPYVVVLMKSVMRIGQ